MARRDEVRERPSGPSATEMRWQIWSVFDEWCENQRVPSLPARPGDVARFLQECASEADSNAWLETHITVLSRMHTRSGMEDPADDPEVRAVLAKQASVKLDPADRDIPVLTLRCLRAVRQTAHRPRRRGKSGHETAGAAEKRGLVDIALISVMRDAFLTAQDAAPLRWKDVDFLADGTTRITLVDHDVLEYVQAERAASPRPQGGTDPDRHPFTNRRWPVTQTGEDAAQDLRAIRPEEHGPDDPVFSLSGNTIKARIKAAALHAGLGTRFTGQSPQRGMYLDLMTSGLATSASMNASSHWGKNSDPDATAELLAEYYRRAEAQQAPQPSPTPEETTR